MEVYVNVEIPGSPSYRVILLSIRHCDPLKRKNPREGIGIPQWTWAEC